MAALHVIDISDPMILIIDNLIHWIPPPTLMIDPFITLCMGACRQVAVILSVIANHHLMDTERARIENDRMAVFPVLPKVHALTVDSNQRYVYWKKREGKRQMI